MNPVTETRLKPDVQVELLADGTRRRLLVALLDDAPGESPITLTERGGETGTPERIEMQHLHLPKLADAGVVRWDRENNLVLQGPQFDELEPLLTVLHDHADELPDEWL